MVFTVVAGWGSEVASGFVFFFSSEGGWLAGLVNMGLGLGYSVCPFFKIPPLHMAYGIWLEVHLYRNLYTCYSRKSCNNYCRDCFL